jgi:hypothetical protein
MPIVPPSSSLQFTIARDIDANASKVFETIVSTQGMERWAPGCERAEWLHPAGTSQPGVGSIRRLLLQGGTVATERIVAWDPGRELHYVMDAPMPIVSPLTRNYVGVTRVEPLGPDRSRLYWQIYFDTPGLLQLSAPVLRPLMKAMIGRMADKIAAIALSA